MAIVLERSKHCFRLTENGTNQSELAFRGASVRLKSQDGPETYFCHWDIEENNPGPVQIFNSIAAEQAVCEFGDANGENMDDVYESETDWSDEDEEDADAEDVDSADEESDDEDEDDSDADDDEDED